MTNKLRQYFPVIRSREEVMKNIEKDKKLKDMFYSWREERREEFLDFCSGARGVKMLYDFAGKEILNPEYNPDRVNELLSLLLKQKVKIIEVLPNDGTRLADENSLLIMDMVVQLEDGSIVNLEIQKIGYKFPGERCACYSADLLLRQYKRIRDKSKKRSCYKDVRDVYTIVLFEQSPEEFKHFPDTYIHRFEQESDTGLEMNLLQKYLFVPLDIFQKIQHNKNGEIKIANRLEAWLAFLCMDRPEEIIAIIEKYPDFKDLYSQIYDMCRNIEEVMAMFSKELLEMDRNTVQLMIDDMQKELDETKDELVGTKGQLDETKGQLDEAKGQLDETKGQLDEAKGQLDEAKGQLDEARNEVELLRRKLAELEGNR